MNTGTMAPFLATLLIVGVLGCGQRTPEDAKHAEATAAFCQEHQIAEAQCPFCDPSLIESLGHCNGHGVPEAFCYQCNAALIPAFKAVGDWCAGHDRPESQCYICNPQLDPARKETPTTETSDAATSPDGPAAATAATDGYVSRAQQPPSTFCSTQSLIIRFDSPDVAGQTGLQFTTVESRPIAKTVECNAEVAYDGSRYTQIAAQVPGTVAEVHKDFGDAVHPGEAIVTITSAHLGTAKASYLQALAAVALWQRNHAREADLLERGVSTEKDLLEAETHLAESRISLSAAEQALLSFGLSKKQVDDVRRTDDTSARYVIAAPFSGIVVDRRATIGEVVDPSSPLFAIADVSRMWALIDVYDSDLPDIDVGQPVVLHVEGLRGESFAGHITWVSSQLNPQTRTLQARAEFDNSGGLLRANMFAHASITVRDHVSSLVVPTSSVQWEGCCNVVFVKKSETVYEPRKVHLGVATGTVYEVLGGVSQGEEIVTQGSFLLKTEILKGSIGAGCCEVDPGA
jgi:cobalt-zinc-cadmium efflux system membrane fusion protein